MAKAKRPKRQTTTAKQLSLAGRRLEAFELRKKGKSYQQIGDALGVSKVTAFKYVRHELDKLANDVTESARELRDIEMARTELLLDAVMKPALTGDLLAVDRAIKLSAFRAKLWGLEAKDFYTLHKGGAVEEPPPVLPSLPADLLAPDFLSIYRDVRDKRHSQYLVKGGRGSTKSSFVSLAIVWLIVNNPEYNALLLRNQTNTLRDSVYSQVQWAVNMLGLSDLFRFGLSPMSIEYLPTGQQVYFRGADKPEKLKGIIPKVGYIAVLWLEELDQFRGKNALRNIKQTALRGGDDSYTFLTYNPPKSAGNWVNIFSLIPRPDQYIHTSDYTTVPEEWLGQPFIDEANFLKEVNPKAYEHEYLGAVTGTGGQVFDNVETRTITAEEIANFDRIYNGVDWGYFPDPYSYGRMHYDSARATLYVFDEYRSIKQSNEQTYAGIREKGYSPEELLVCDSAEPKSVGDYLSYGANARGAEKGPGSVDYSMKWLQTRTKIVIDPTRAPSHAIEFTGYELEMDSHGEFYSSFPDKNNHSIDDTRYAMNPVWRRRGQ